MFNTLTNFGIDMIKKAAQMLTGQKKREYIAGVTLDYLDGNARKAERVFGRGRHTVEKGINELKSGIKCADNYAARGNKRTEDKNKALSEDIRTLVEPQSQTDPDFKTVFRYTRITAKAVRTALIEEKGWSESELPSENTIRNMLNRPGYRLRKVQKTKPLKKIPETDDIFKNTANANREADEDSETLRISVDVKAKVNVGEFSRNGEARAAEAEKAADHDMNPDAKLVPVGIFEPVSGSSTIIFGNSHETSDLLADSIRLWWESNAEQHSGIKKLTINLDNGPHVHSHRTWFIKRMTEFADDKNLEIRLVYYPPYHSKYNPVERVWGILENHRNGTLLNSVGTALNWAGTMTWNGIRPVIHFLDKVYEKGKKLTQKEMKQYEERLNRSEKLPKWDVTILPQIG